MSDMRNFTINKSTYGHKRSNSSFLEANFRSEVSESTCRGRAHLVNSCSPQFCSAAPENSKNVQSSIEKKKLTYTVYSRQKIKRPPK